MALLCCLPAASAEVRVWQDTLTLPTYDEGAPDPNPPFDLFAATRFNYPYTLRETLTGRREEHAWRAVYLENEYLKCSILPDIGGHIYTCLDKISGKPIFYANPSIKKALIGYRGAWAAFGVEFNFPVSHNWASMSPVDFAFAKHSDGSASVTVGNIDRVYGMQWTVELLLHPGSAVLEQRVMLYNRSDFRHRFYWWSNAGVEAWDDSRIEYPMRYAASHGFTEVQTWPVDSSGTDLSIIRNQAKGPVSLFVHGSREPFMGVWHPATNTGVVHFSDYGDLPAKKIWSWGVDADGLDWRTALSDNNSAYVEVQGGLFRNQETYAFLEPRQSIHFSEYWMPVRAIGGITRANLAGVLHMSRQGSILQIGFNSNHRIPAASLRMLDGARVISDERLDLTPERSWLREVPISDVTRAYTFELRDRSGKLLLRHKEGEYDWTPESDIRVGPQAAHTMPEPAKRSADDWLRIGTDDELNGNLLKALDTYRRGLQVYPDSFGLSLSAGRLAASLLIYDEAVQHLQRVRERDTSNPEIAYYLGIAYEGNGEDRKALECFEAAQHLPSFHGAGMLRIGEMKARLGDRKAAEQHFAEALRSAPDDVRAAEELAAVQSSLGEEDVARSLAATWLSRSPVSYFLLDQSGKPDLAHLAADPYRVLNIAAQYMRLCLFERALQVLDRTYPAVPSDQAEPGSILPQDHVLVAYYRAYCKQKLGRSADRDYAEAQKLSTAYIFPNTAETVTVLQAARRANPRDAVAHYLLGTFYFSRGLADPALAAWAIARENNARIPVLHASTGLALLRVKRDPEKALAVFRAGISVDPQNTQLYFGSDQALSLLGHPAKERVSALEHYPDLANMPSELVYELALNRAEAGDFQGALALFHNRFFARQEGGTNVREVWFEIRLQKVLATGDTGSCGVAMAESREVGSEVPGIPFTRDGLEPMLKSARTNYLLGDMESRCGDTRDAVTRFRNASEDTRPSELIWAHAAAKRLNEDDNAKWKALSEAALASARSRDENETATSWSLYESGLLEYDLGDRQSAEAHFRDALLLPNRLLAYHLLRLALSGTLPK